MHNLVHIFKMSKIFIISEPLYYRSIKLDNDAFGDFSFDVKVNKKGIKYVCTLQAFTILLHRNGTINLAVFINRFLRRSHRTWSQWSVALIVIAATVYNFFDSSGPISVSLSGSLLSVKQRTWKLKPSITKKALFYTSQYCKERSNRLLVIFRKFNW